MARGEDASGDDRSAHVDALHHQAILLQCKAGVHEGYVRLAELWGHRLWAFVHHLVPDHADDIYGEVWAQVLAKVRGVRDHERLPGWLYSVAHNVAMMHLRRLKVVEPLYDDEQLTTLETTEDIVLAGENAEHVRRALSTLHTTHREVLTLHFLEGFPVKEIAEITQVPVGTVKSRLYHAKLHLRTALKREDRTDDGA